MSTLLPEQQQQQMAQNPMLPQHPVTAALDAQYYAQEAVLRQKIAQQHADLLQQLGYTDAQGNVIPGSVEVNAQRQGGELQRQSGLAAQGVTEAAQRNGTLFSGRREQDTARAEYPYQNQIAQLGIDTPMQLSQLHEQAAGLVDQYTLQNNQLLADAATRASASATANPAAVGATPSGPLSPNDRAGAMGADPYHEAVQTIHQQSLKALQNNPRAAQTARDAI